MLRRNKLEVKDNIGTNKFTTEQWETEKYHRRKEYTKRMERQYNNTHF